MGVAQIALRRLLHFAALYIVHLSFMRLQHRGFPGHTVKSGALLTVVGQSSRYTDHGFVATKDDVMPPAFPPATWSTEQVST